MPAFVGITSWKLYSSSWDEFEIFSADVAMMKFEIPTWWPNLGAKAQCLDIDKISECLNSVISKCAVVTGPILIFHI